jgi:hypothetical protein
MDNAAVAGRVSLATRVDERWLPAVILVGGCLNGLAVRVVEQLAAGGLTLSLGIGPFQLITLLVATRLILTPRETPATLPAGLHALALVLMLVPSSSVAWLAVGLYAVVLAIRSDGATRTGALLFLAMAGAALWSSVALKWLATPVTTVEATVVGYVVQWVRPDITQVGNVIGNREVHSLVLMTACTTADALPSAAVAMVAVALLLGTPDRDRLPVAALALAVLYAVANTLRLGAMAWSGEMYDLIHGPIGANAFDVVQTVFVLGLGSWMSRP